MKNFKVALVGRPNVGKSTLFNRLTSSKHAIVEDTPGVTRDWKEGHARLGPIEFTVYDTAGLEEAAKNELASRMTLKTEQAISFCDLVLFIVDGQIGLLPEDRTFAKWLHKKNKPVVLLINKAENKQAKENVSEFFALGFKEYAVISAEHGEGLMSLFDVIDPYLSREITKENNENNEEVISIAIAGRPNAGKSTLINALLKQERVLTGPEPGITRDSIAIEWQYKGQKIKLVDTAGMRKKSNITNELEKLAVSDSIRAINFAQIVILLMDVNNALEVQDLQIAEKVLEEGRCLILGFNKCDNIKDHNEIQKLVDKRIEIFNKYLDFVPYITLSAQNEINIYKLIDKAIELHKEWNITLDKRRLNQWLDYITSEHPLPLAPSGKRVRIKYIRQIKTRPPSFLLFTNHPELVSKPYQKYMMRHLREDFGLKSVPLRFNLRKTKNPYSSEK
ncbi:MAG: ribosome biogenesis GTPase Der [Sphingobacteriia bacterium]|nr:ribosome biogenesis GTPase Der [Sphingobacteriia bacterium]